LATAVVGLAWRPAGLPIRIEAAETKVPGGLVFVSQWNADVDGPGCNASSIFAAATGRNLHRAQQRFDWAITKDFQSTSNSALVLATSGAWASTHTDYMYHLVALRPTRDDMTAWRDELITGARFAPGKGIAIMPDDETIIVETLDDDGNAPGLTPGNTHLDKYRISEISPDGALGPRRGRFDLPDRHVQLYVDRDGRTVHALTSRGIVLTIDTRVMSESATQFLLPERQAFNNDLFMREGAITPESNYIISRSYTLVGLEDYVVVSDLRQRKSWKARLPSVPCGRRFQPGHGECGDIAINHADVNHGLIAVRGLDWAYIYSFVPPDTFRRLGRAYVGVYPEYARAPIAWSADGARLLVATRNRERDEVAVVRVMDGGESASIERYLDPCPRREGLSIPYDIYTQNRVLERVPTIPIPTSTATQTPTASATPKLLVPSPTATPSTTPTPVPTRPSPTSEPSVLHLPLLLHEPPCKKVQLSADIVLVLDTSSSMGEPTHNGETKLAAAVSAARALVSAAELNRGSRVAIVTFDADARTALDLTADRSAIERAVAGLGTGRMTCIPCALEEAEAALARRPPPPDAARVVVLLTDGRSNPRPVAEALTVAERLKADGVAIHAVGLGDDLEREVLREMASRPEDYHEAPDAEDLLAIYERIAIDIPCPSGRYWGRR
jgi:uncharacterized protein YegL